MVTILRPPLRHEMHSHTRNMTINGRADGDGTPPSHGLAQAAITHPHRRAKSAHSRARPQAHNTHMHPASCQLFSGTQQLVVQAHVPIFLFMRSDTYAPRDTSQGDPG